MKVLVFIIDFVAKDGIDPLSPVEEAAIAGSLPEIHPESESTVSFTVVGASGDLAKKKIFWFGMPYECQSVEFLVEIVVSPP